MEKFLRSVEFVRITNFAPRGTTDTRRSEERRARYRGIVPLARKSPAGTLFQWNIEGWSNRRVDSNQVVDSTLQVDSTIGLNRPSGLIGLPGLTRILVGSSLRIDSTPRILFD